MGKRILITTGGGDCPGLNAVIRAIVKRAGQEEEWEVLGSIDAFHGILKDPMEIMQLDKKTVAGIHVRGGTIIGTTNKGSPFAWPIKKPDGSWENVDRSDELIRRLKSRKIDAVVNIGGDGSQDISQRLFRKGVNIIGVPKTIDNDLSCTDFTFGFQTAVEVATDAVDKLVTTAASHNRVMILEVMGRGAGWIALSAAVAGGAEVVLIPEIPYDIEKVAVKLRSRIKNGKGFAIIVVAEGAKPVGGKKAARESDEVGYQNVRLGGIGFKLMDELKKRLDVSMRVTVLGHLQRGGIPCAFDRILATQFGVKAVELIKDGKYGRMVAYRHPDIVDVSLEDVTAYNLINQDNYLLKTARGHNICLGD
ncbi:ATP-dependent 6-phosphofructokinase [bacterium]|nr:ATP-dependent 6-phosphofructokinase [bacterium]